MSGPPAVASVVVASGIIFAFAFNYLPDEWSAPDKLPRYFGSLLSALCVSTVLFGWLVWRDKSVPDYRWLATATTVGNRIAKQLRADDQGNVGIGHFLDDQVVSISPLSTAYAARAILACPRAITDAPLVQLYKSLGASNLGRGWKAASQAKARPEVTSDILRTIRELSGDSEQYRIGITQLQAQVDNDPTCLKDAYVASNALAAFPDMTTSQAIRLRDAIDLGFCSDGTSGFWGESLSRGVEENQASAWATARCLIALAMHPELRRREASRNMAQKAFKYLGAAPEFARETSQLVRQVPGARDENLAPRHFTSALVVIAATSWHEIRGAKAVAVKALAGVCGAFQDDSWRWTDGSKPVWMNAQGIEAISAYFSTALAKIDAT
jgi:hypothetical protein